MPEYRPRSGCSPSSWRASRWCPTTPAPGTSGSRIRPIRSRKVRAPARERSSDHLRGAGWPPASDPHHGLLGLERRGGSGHHGRPLSGPALAFAGLREHRSRGVLPLRPVASLCALQARLPARARDHLAGHGVLHRPAASPRLRPRRRRCIEPHLKWRTYCAAVLELTRHCEASLVLTLGALLAEVAHSQPIRLVGGAHDPELASRLGIRPTRYEGPTGIVGVLNTLCREAGMPTASLWANVPHYISGIENPKAALALVRRVLVLLNAGADLSDLSEAARQFEQNLNGIVAQNAKIAEYVSKLERKKPEDDDSGQRDELPPSGDLVAEIEQFLRQQRPEGS